MQPMHMTSVWDCRQCLTTTTQLPSIQLYPTTTEPRSCATPTITTTDLLVQGPEEVQLTPNADRFSDEPVAGVAPPRPVSRGRPSPLPQTDKSRRSPNGGRGGGEGVRAQTGAGSPKFRSPGQNPGEVLVGLVRAWRVDNAKTVEMVAKGQMEAAVKFVTDALYRHGKLANGLGGLGKVHTPTIP